MRMFQVQFEEINDYGWILGNEEYESQYAKSREENLLLIEIRKNKLAEMNIVVMDKPTDSAIITQTQLCDLYVTKFRFTVVTEVPVSEDEPQDLTGVIRKFNKMAAKLLSAPILQPNVAEGLHTAFNSRVEVHMPGQALSTYNEILLLENTCSDEIQDSLDKGWRIITALPQPDARRPDYVLGRYDPNRDNGNHSRAKREP